MDKQESEIQRYVDKHVLCNMSKVIEHLKDTVTLDVYSEAEQAALYNRPVDDLQIIEAGFNVFRHNDKWYYCEEDVGRPDDHVLKYREIFNTEAECIKGLAEKEKIIGREVSSHYVVTRHLADELEQIGEAVVFDYFGLNIWGRVEKQQEISSDYVIRKIFRRIQQNGGNW